jgi:hypothetical protein
MQQLIHRRPATSVAKDLLTDRYRDCEGRKRGVDEGVV